MRTSSAIRSRSWWDDAGSRPERPTSSFVPPASAHRHRSPRPPERRWTCSRRRPRLLPMAAARVSNALRDFVKLRPEVEAVLQHVGLRTWDLMLVDATGLWVRDEFESQESAQAACRELGVRMHDGWDDARINRRMGARNHWTSPDGQRRAQ